MASDQVPYHHGKTKSDEPSAAAVDTATDRGLFGFAGKKEEEKKCEGEVIADEFDKKVEVSEEKEETKKHGSLLEKLQRSNSSSSSSSEEEVEENGEKKKKKKDKIGKGEDTNIAVDKAGDEEKKGFLEKIKEKLPGGKKAEDVASPPPTPAPAAAPAQPATSPGAEKKGLLDKIKEKIPGHSKTDEEKEDEKENQCK